MCVISDADTGATYRQSEVLNADFDAKVPEYRLKIFGSHLSDTALRAGRVFVLYYGVLDTEVPKSVRFVD